MYSLVIFLVTISATISADSKATKLQPYLERADLSTDEAFITAIRTAVCHSGVVASGSGVVYNYVLDAFFAVSSLAVALAKKNNYDLALKAMLCGREIIRVGERAEYFSLSHDEFASMCAGNDTSYDKYTITNAKSAIYFVCPFTRSAYVPQNRTEYIARVADILQTHVIHLTLLIVKQPDDYIGAANDTMVESMRYRCMTCYTHYSYDTLFETCVPEHQMALTRVRRSVDVPPDAGPSAKTTSKPIDNCLYKYGGVEVPDFLSLPYGVQLGYMMFSRGVEACVTDLRPAIFSVSGVPLLNVVQWARGLSSPWFEIAIVGLTLSSMLILTLLITLITSLAVFCKCCCCCKRCCRRLACWRCRRQQSLPIKLSRRAKLNGRLARKGSGDLDPLLEGGEDEDVLLDTNSYDKGDNTKTRSTRRAVAPQPPRYPKIAKYLVLGIVLLPAVTSKTVNLPSQAGNVIYIGSGDNHVPVYVQGREDYYSMGLLRRGVTCHVEATYRVCCAHGNGRGCSKPDGEEEAKMAKGWRVYSTPTNCPSCRNDHRSYVTASAYADNQYCESSSAFNSRVYIYRMLVNGTDTLSEYAVAYIGSRLYLTIGGCNVTVTTGNHIGWEGDTDHITTCLGVFGKIFRVTTALIPPVVATTVHVASIETHPSLSQVYFDSSMVNEDRSYSPYFCSRDGLGRLTYPHLTVEQALNEKGKPLLVRSVVEYVSRSGSFIPLAAMIPMASNITYDDITMTIVDYNQGMISLIYDGTGSELSEHPSAVLSSVAMIPRLCYKDWPSVIFDVMVNASQPGSLSITCDNDMCVPSTIMVMRGPSTYVINVKAVPRVTVIVGTNRVTHLTGCKESTGIIDPFQVHGSDVKSIQDKTKQSWLDYLGIIVPSILMFLLGLPIVGLFLKSLRGFK